MITEPHAYIGEGEIIDTLPAAGEKTTQRITVYVSAGWQKNE